MVIYILILICFAQSLIWKLEPFLAVLRRRQLLLLPHLQSWYSSVALLEAFAILASSGEYHCSLELLDYHSVRPRLILVRR